MFYTVHVTGHRPDKLPGGYNSQHKELEDKLYEVCVRYYNANYRTFISGGAIGTDQIFARAVIRLKASYPDARLIIARPFPSQDRKWFQSSKNEFKWICDRADQVVDVSPDPYSPAKMQIRNIWMVDRSHTTLAVYNGSGGGTKNCIDYALSRSNWVVVIDPVSLVETLLENSGPKPVEPGNIWSGSKSLAALTNPTEIALWKGNVSKHYPIVVDGKHYKDSEEAYQKLKSTASPDEIMLKVLQIKLLSYPELIDMIDNAGGRAWLALCSHQVFKPGSYWEGVGIDSGFIRTLIKAYENIKGGNICIR